jgi:sensor histidine kinase YesM
MGPRLAYAFDLPDALRDTPVPPLLLQPLVENCIAHGLEPKVAGGRIDVTAERDGDRLVLRVRDSGVGLGAATAQPGTRFGLVQVRERLAALYGAAASFVLEPGADGAGTEARIAIPITTPPATTLAKPP